MAIPATQQHYGEPVVLDAADNVRAVKPGDNSSIYGFLVRPYPSSPATTPTSETPESGPVDILRRGYLGVRVYGSATAAKDGQVYVWAKPSGGDHVLGGIEAEMAAINGFALPGAVFTGPQSGDLAEIAFNLEIEAQQAVTPAYEAMLGVGSVTADATVVP